MCVGLALGESLCAVARQPACYGVVLLNTRHVNCEADDEKLFIKNNKKRPLVPRLRRRARPRGLAGY